MSKFGRSFETEALAQHLDHATLIKELFKRWDLPGENCAGQGLRIAVRNGYLNMYVGGQSVAKLEAGASGIRVALHEKYFVGAHKGSKDEQKYSQRYKTLKGDEIRPSNPSEEIDRWIATAATYCGPEKLFVDSLIAHNPNTIDLEMALPGDQRVLNKKGSKTSPRMDLTTVNLQADGTPVLNFWEVKCANNSELRADQKIDFKSEEGAHVAHQLARYWHWLSFDDNSDDIRMGYQETAKVLLNLALIFGKDLESPACRFWSTLAEKKPEIVCRPGIAISNYHPRPSSWTERQKMRHFKRSFSDHRKRLTDLGITVVEFDSFLDTIEPLPNLEDGVLKGWVARL